MKRILSVFSRPAYLAQGCSVAGSALLTLASAAIITPDERGVLAVVVLWMTMGSYLASLGLPSRMLAHGARADAATAAHLLSRFLPLSFLIAAGTFVLISWSAITPVPTYLAAVCAVGMFAGSALNMLGWYDYGTGRFVRSTVLRGIIPGASFAALAISSLRGSGDPLLWCAVTYALTSGAAALWLSRAIWVGAHLGPQVALGKELRSGSAYFGVQGLTLVWLRAPVIVGGAVLGPPALAVASLALSISEIQSYLPQMRAAITFSEESRGVSPRLRAAHLHELAVLLLPGALLAGAVGLSAPVVLEDAYSDLAWAVAAALPGSAALAIASSSINVLTAQNRNGAAAAILLVGAAIAFLALGAGLQHSVEAGLGAWSCVSVAMAATLTLVATRSPEMARAHG